MKKLSKILPLFLLVVLMYSCTSEINQPENFEAQLVSLIQKSNLNKNALFVYGMKNKTIIYELKDGWETGWAAKQLGARLNEELCRGEGLKFARCVKDAIDLGQCVLVYKDGDKYVAIPTKCPEEITPAN